MARQPNQSNRSNVDDISANRGVNVDVSTATLWDAEKIDKKIMDKKIEVRSAIADQISNGRTVIFLSLIFLSLFR
jgi:hypothetical protein